MPPGSHASPCTSHASSAIMLSLLRQSEEWLRPVQVSHGRSLDAVLLLAPRPHTPAERGWGSNVSCSRLPSLEAWWWGACSKRQRGGN